jgi:hypothetical protein
MPGVRVCALAEMLMPSKNAADIKMLTNFFIISS